MKQSVEGIGMTSRRTRERLIQRLEREGIRDVSVLEAIRDVPRHLFVDEALASRAYEDTALPIGAGQTISQPYVVALMTEALVVGRRPSRVLEVGAGCGYQSAVLARLVATVYSVERLDGLLRSARERLHGLGIHNVRMRHGDGREGWPEHAPFDGIMVAAAPIGIPPALLEQLAMEGRLIIPVGTAGRQQLVEITRTGDGYDRRKLEDVSFVPMLDGTA